MTVDSGPPTPPQPSAEYRLLPSVDRLTGHPRLTAIGVYAGSGLLLDMARAALDAAREDIGRGAGAPDVDDLAEDVAERVRTLLSPGPRRVLNAAGVIIHTNLGRSPLSEAAQDAMLAVSAGYSDLEYDLREGARGTRHAHPERLLQILTGAEAAIVVNNNAAAVLLALSAVATGREVIVSRGEAIEIGGRFRIPDIMRQSGARLVEVGTTNRTYADDYGDAVTDETAALLRVHHSNFAMVGFTHTPDPAEVADIAQRNGLTLINDLGSGCFLPTEPYGLAHEPTVRDAIQKEGADIALFSGDKLLGGPQAGIAVGKRDQIDRLKRHPLARAVRIDKLDLAALTATLLAYLRGTAEQEIPIWRMIAAELLDIDARAHAWADAIGAGGANVVDARTAVGGGSLPQQTLPTRALAIPAALCGDGGPEALAARLREPTAGARSARATPVIGRIDDDMLLLDPRTVLPEDDDELLTTLRQALMA